MKKLFLFCIIVFCTISCAKTEYSIFSTLHGVVSNGRTGEPLENVNVQLNPGGITKLTGSDGWFEFRDIEPRQYTVTVQKSGFATNRKAVDAVSGEVVEVSIPMTEL